MRNISKYRYEYQKKDIELSPGQTRIIRLCVEWSIKVHDPIADLQRVISACPGSNLNPYTEAVHIFAWFLKLKAENRGRNIWRYEPNSRFDFSHSLLSWWRNTRRAEGMELASKNQPHFKDALAWFKAQELKDEKEKPSPDLWSEVKNNHDSDAYRQMSVLRAEYTGEDLTDRFLPFLDAIGYRSIPYPESMDRLITFWDLGRIKPDLAEFIKVESFGLAVTIRILQNGGELEKLFRNSIENQARNLLIEAGEFHPLDNQTNQPAEHPDPAGEQEEEFITDNLQKVRVRLKDSRIPRIGYVLTSSDSESVIRLNAPLQNGSMTVTISNDRITKVEAKQKTNQPSPELQAQLDRIINEHRQRISSP